MLRDDGLAAAAAADVDAVAVDGLADAVLGRWRFSCCRVAAGVFSRRFDTRFLMGGRGVVVMMVEDRIISWPVCT